eukprot:TRINITY_DN73051_c0_g1_i1.p1 TRINITY_DN73051_c0_g1~~TRINITY_DN73051_c0_g1_i1.p1  ORF type:complete len:199 (-),score=35.21 TRINITY_DN73051_c0_g1_i1:228-824(-)
MHDDREALEAQQRQPFLEDTAAQRTSSVGAADARTATSDAVAAHPAEGRRLVDGTTSQAVGESVRFGGAALESRQAGSVSNTGSSYFAGKARRLDGTEGEEPLPSPEPPTTDGQVGSGPTIVPCAVRLGGAAAGYAPGSTAPAAADAGMCSQAALFLCARCHRAVCVQHRRFWMGRLLCPDCQMGARAEVTPLPCSIQ